MMDDVPLFTHEELETAVLSLKNNKAPDLMGVGDVEVQSVRAAKYLGVMVDSKLSWRDQIFRTADKAAKVISSLSRLMANVGGPRSSRRRLLMSTVQSVLLYGAELWADALNKEVYRMRLARDILRTKKLELDRDAV
ncbi:uncharacterized protein LOC128992900 [Macrosteles quadrilineatus]|uniref:uncharacterized protein LOC128992900 n=1 Tax=Macrosteles quadrilineatus TaxID=74068 RepID=UPI0023E1686C|nr:uncharacterized protein LOC128992900 [Macrosteles quadrilineatus]